MSCEIVWPWYIYYDEILSMRAFLRLFMGKNTHQNFSKGYLHLLRFSYKFKVTNLIRMPWNVISFSYQIDCSSTIMLDNIEEKILVPIMASHDHPQTELSSHKFISAISGLAGKWTYRNLLVFSRFLLNNKMIALHLPVFSDD